MTHLLSINPEYSKLYNDSTIDNMKNWISNNLKNMKEVVTTTNYIAITAITCIAITSFPKIVALGCITVSALAYDRLAGIVKYSDHKLISTRAHQKVVESLSAPKLNAEVLELLKEELFKITCDMRDALNALEKELPLERPLLETYLVALDNQQLFRMKLSYLGMKLPSGNLRERSSKIMSLEDTLKQFSADLVHQDLDLSQLDADSAHQICDLQSVKKGLKEGSRSSLRSTLLEKHEKILKNAEDLHKKVQALQTNKSFFKENGAFFQKITNVLLEIDLNTAHKSASCRNFMFYSLTATVLIKLGRFLKVASDANWADAMLTNESIANSYLIMGLGGLAAVYAVKNALSLIAHRNDEVKKHERLATVTKDEWNSWTSLTTATT